MPAAFILVGSLGGTLFANPFGEAPLRTGYILAAANAPGAHGTFWKTDVWIHNAGDRTATVGFWFLPAGHAGDQAAHGQIGVEPGETTEIHNILGTILRVTDPIGAIEYRVIEGPEVFVQSRTYSSGSEAPPVAASSIGDAATTTEPIVASALRRSAVFRTNLALVNPLPKTVDATIEIIDDDERPAGTQRVSLEPRSYAALNDVLAAVGRARESSAIIRVEGEGRLFALASVLSSETGEVTSKPAARRLP